MSMLAKGRGTLTTQVRGKGAERGAMGWATPLRAQLIEDCWGVQKDVQLRIVRSRATVWWEDHRLQKGAAVLQSSVIARPK